MYRFSSGRWAAGAMVAALSFFLVACTSVNSPEARDISAGQDYDLSEYRSIILDPVEVSFDPSWRPVATGSHIAMSERERDNVKNSVAALFDEKFSEELASGGSLRVVDRAASGVLQVTPRLEDVYLSAPLPMLNPGRTYVRSVGHMTLHLVFKDAASGETVLELRDRVRGRDIGLLRPADPVYNEIEMSRIFEDWAQIIRQDLFRAR